MKRLTYPGDYCQDIAQCNNNCGGSCQGKRIWEKLRAYEDTGLSPEEVEDLKMETPKSCKECMYASTCRSWYGGTSCKYKDNDQIFGISKDQRREVATHGNEH